MSIIYSGTTIATVKYGSTTLDKVYYGSTLVYTRDTNTYIFKNGTLGSGVTLTHSRTSLTNTYIQFTVDRYYQVSCTFNMSYSIPSGKTIYVYLQTISCSCSSSSMSFIIDLGKTSYYSLDICDIGYHIVSDTTTSNISSISLICNIQFGTGEIDFRVYKVYY